MADSFGHRCFLMTAVRLFERRYVVRVPWRLDDAPRGGWLICFSTGATMLEVCITSSVVDVPMFGLAVAKTADALTFELHVEGRVCGERVQGGQGHGECCRGLYL